MTYEALRATILALVDVSEDELDADGNLIDYGLDSMMVFELLATWQQEGLSVDVAALAETPTLNGWWRALAPQGGAPG